MSKINTMLKLLRGDKRQFLIAVYNNIVHTGILNCLSDKLYLKITYWIRFGKRLNLDTPITFNEKLQWLKLNDHNPDYIKMVDKILVKEYVANLIGKEFIIPTLGIYDSFDEIDFSLLPNQFVLKCNHDSGSVVICKDKSSFDINKAKRKISKGLKTDAYYWGREWPYKLMVFNGKVKCSFVASDRFSADGLKITFFDTDWNIMPFERHYPKSKEIINKPLNYELMVCSAEKLSENIPFSRIDFYEVGGKAYFGAITLYPGSGWEEFTQSQWDEVLGN